MREEDKTQSGNNQGRQPGEENYTFDHRKEPGIKPRLWPISSKES
jgi:hypothetical protein